MTDEYIAIDAHQRDEYINDLISLIAGRIEEATYIDNKAHEDYLKVHDEYRKAFSDIIVNFVNIISDLNLTVRQLEEKVSTLEKDYGALANILYNSKVDNI